MTVAPVVQQMLDEMKARRVSGVELCRRAGYDRRIMSDLKRGAHSPRVSTLLHMGQVLGLELVWRPVSSMTTDTNGRATDNQAQ